MQCPKCGHNVANGGTACIYCGAALGTSTFVEDPDSFRKGKKTRFSREGDQDGTLYEVIEEIREGDVPEDWQRKIEELIQGGGGDVAPDSVIDVFSVLSHVKTPRKRRLHPLILALIFLVSAGVVGIVLWLLG